MNIILMTDSSIPIFSPDSVAGYISTVIVAAIGFLLTVFILKKLLYTPILKALHARQRTIDEQFREAERVRSEAEEGKKKLEASVAESETQAAKLLQSSKEQAEQQMGETLAEARREAEQILDNARRESERMRKEADERIYREAVDLAMKVVESYLAGESGACSQPSAADSQPLRQELDALTRAERPGDQKAEALRQAP